MDHYARQPETPTYSACHCEMRRHVGLAPANGHCRPNCAVLIRHPHKRSHRHPGEVRCPVDAMQAHADEDQPIPSAFAIEIDDAGFWSDRWLPLSIRFH